MNSLAAINAGAPKAEQQRIQRAAQDFEALLIGQLLQAARAEREGSATESVQSMAEQQLAAVMAGSGGLGLGKLVIRGLEHRNPGNSRSTGVDAS